MSKRRSPPDQNVEVIGTIMKNRREAIRVGVRSEGNRQQIELRLCSVSPDGKRLTPGEHVFVLRPETVNDVIDALLVAAARTSPADPKAVCEGARVIPFRRLMIVRVVLSQGTFEVRYEGGPLDHELKPPIATFKAAVSANFLADRLADLTGRTAVHAEGFRDD